MRMNSRGFTDRYILSEKKFMTEQLENNKKNKFSIVSFKLHAKHFLLLPVMLNIRTNSQKYALHIVS